MLTSVLVSSSTPVWEDQDKRHCVVLKPELVFLCSEQRRGVLHQSLSGYLCVCFFECVAPTAVLLMWVALRGRMALFDRRWRGDRGYVANTIFSRCLCSSVMKWPVSCRPSPNNSSIQAAEESLSGRGWIRYLLSLFHTSIFDPTVVLTRHHFVSCVALRLFVWGACV